MKRILLVLCLLGVVVNVFSQRSKWRKRQRPTLGVYYSPAISFRQLNYASDQQFLADQRNDVERQKFGFSAGIILQRRLLRQNKLELALGFTNMGYRTISSQLSWVPPDPSLPVSARYIYSYHFIDLSLRYHYWLGGRKVRYYIIPAIAVNGLINRKTTTVLEYADGSTDKSSSDVRGGYRGAVFAPSISMGASIPLSPKFSISLQPCFRYQVQSISRGEGNGEHLYSYGINAVLLYHRNINKFKRKIK